jgi:hypothetical protein
MTIFSWLSVKASMGQSKMVDRRGKGRNPRRGSGPARQGHAMSNRAGFVSRRCVLSLAACAAIRAPQARRDRLACRCEKSRDGDHHWHPLPPGRYFRLTGCGVLFGCYGTPRRWSRAGGDSHTGSHARRPRIKRCTARTNSSPCAAAKRLTRDVRSELWRRAYRT